ncbi:MAG: HD domain-containing protein [Actinomycetia bacterium]|nr:HD domain-containing protein [Actinomycetes bacterium]
MTPETTATPSADPVGSLAWLRSTGGLLTASERRALTRAILAAQGGNLVGRLKLLLGRRPSAGPPELIDPPDTAMTRAAEELCWEQPAPIAAHSARTWLFGAALAQYDSADLDEELFYVASLLHDVGLPESVPGQDFTLRSVAAAAEVVTTSGGTPTQTDAVSEAIARHTTPGVTSTSDGELATYLQAGALLDLAGVRSWDLSERFLAGVMREYDRRGFESEILAAIAAEATAVPEGRFALLARWGLPLAIKTAPFPR